MSIQRMIGAVGALILSAGVVLALATPAQADGEHLPAAPWATNGESSIVDPTTVHLQDHATGDTSIENPSVGLNVQAGATISVEYELVDDEAGAASCQAGEPRLFAFINGTLNKSALCDGTGDDATSGTLSFEAANSGLVERVGLVYSRDTGHVVMRNLTVDGRLVLFAELPDLCEVEGLEDLAADDPGCVEPDPSPSPTVEASPSPSTDAASKDDDDSSEKAAASLPVTGSTPLLFAGGAVLLLAVGGGLFWVARRRRVTFTS